MKRSCKKRDVKKENDKKSFTFDHKIPKTIENCDRTQTLEDQKCQQFQTPKKRGNKNTCDENATPFEPSARNNEDSKCSIANECVAPSSEKAPTLYEIGDLSLPELKLSKRSRRKRFLPQIVRRKCVSQ